MSNTPEQPRDRLEREINEILDGLPELPPKRALPPLRRMGSTVSMPITKFIQTLVHVLARVSAVQLLELSVALIVLGFLFRGILPFAGFRLLAAGSLLLITSFAMFLFFPSTERRKARDRVIENESSSLLEVVRDWWHRLRQPR
jgi:hypothetical protein